MKVNWDASITDFDGKEVKDGESLVTVHVLARNAFNSVIQGDAEANREMKLNRYELMKRIIAKGEITDSDYSIIQERVVKVYPNPWLVGVFLEKFKAIE